MRKISALAVVLIAIVALAACGGSSKKAATSSNSSSPSSSTSSGSSSSAAAAGGTGGDFCQQIVDSRAENIGQDPNTAKEALAILKKVSPPHEIKDDWDDYLAALQELGDASQSDQGALATIAAKHVRSLSAVSLYISKSCLRLGSSELSSLSDSLSSLSSSQGN